jgi:hypothetical protein
VRFEGDKLVIRPKLYPNSPALSADLRLREGRLRLDISRDGRVKRASFNDRPLKVSKTGEVALP